MERWLILISIFILIILFFNAGRFQKELDKKNIHIGIGIIKLFAVISIVILFANQLSKHREQNLTSTIKRSEINEDVQKQIDLINLEKQKKDYMTEEEAIQSRKDYESKKQEEYDYIHERIISYSNLHFVKSVSDIKQFLSIIKDTQNAILLSEDSDLKERSKKSLHNFQKINFPLARKIYYNNAKEKLWEKNIEVKLNGRDITFEGYMFADNGTIKATYEEIRKELEDLRFKTVGFRWYEGGDRTYWKLNVKNDGDI